MRLGSVDWVYPNSKFDDRALKRLSMSVETTASLNRTNYTAVGFGSQQASMLVGLLAGESDHTRNQLREAQFQIGTEPRVIGFLSLSRQLRTG